ncbi:hypothetical protein JZ751_016574 [Albula glossodonta]|uniref:Uncharacterized protein n=1 Tax=Albula glossodonta TaxID=121402 RepID=A0A8T2N2K4_9TELE|nr:hypothetical protein JZ751_016574 [Albula glossodonta]
MRINNSELHDLSLSQGRFKARLLHSRQSVMDGIDYTGVEQNPQGLEHGMEGSPAYVLSREEREILSNIKEEVVDDMGTGIMGGVEMGNEFDVKEEDVIKFWVKEERESDEEIGRDENAHADGENNGLFFSGFADPSSWNHNTGKSRCLFHCF